MKIQPKSLLLYLTLQAAATAVAAFQLKKIPTSFLNRKGITSSISCTRNLNHDDIDVDDDDSAIFISSMMHKIRGGDDNAAPTATTTTADDNDVEQQQQQQQEEEEVSLEDRVHAAMRKLGLSVDNNHDDDGENQKNNAECTDGVCAIPTSPPPLSSSSSETTTTTTTTTTAATSPQQVDTSNEDIHTVMKRIAKEMDVDESIVFAAINATLKPTGEAKTQENDNLRINENAARVMIQNEIDAIQRVMEDCEEVSFSKKKRKKRVIHKMIKY